MKKKKKKKKKKIYVYFTNVPRGKPSYRRQFGCATCQIATVGVVEEGVREGVEAALQNSRVVYVCDF